MGFPKTHLVDQLPPLKQAGIDKNLADRARKLLGLTLKELKLFVIDGRADVERSIL
jgi:hypothetical protein